MLWYQRELIAGCVLAHAVGLTDQALISPPGYVPPPLGPPCDAPGCFATFETGDGISDPFMSRVIAAPIWGAPTTIDIDGEIASGNVPFATFTVKVEVPAAVGIPVSAPVAAKTIPAGIAPELTDQVKGDVPLA